MNICYCGAMAGYPHVETCPYPLYHATEAMERKWFEAREEKLAQLKEAGYAVIHED